jgi:hypothetical protein
MHIWLGMNEVPQQPVAGCADGARVRLVARDSQGWGVLPVAPLDVPDIGEPFLQEQAGPDRRGVQHAGVLALTPGQLAADVIQRWRVGWRELTSCGDRPAPPRHGEDGQVGGFAEHPGSGRRTWWAELASAAAVR